MTQRRLSRLVIALAIFVVVDLAILTGLLIYQVQATAHRSTSHFGFIACVLSKESPPQSWIDQCKADN